MSDLALTHRTPPAPGLGTTARPEAGPGFVASHLQGQPAPVAQAATPSAPLAGAGSGLGGHPIDPNLRANLGRFMPADAEPRTVAPNVVVWNAPEGGQGFAGVTGDGHMVVGRRDPEGRTTLTPSGYLASAAPPRYAYEGDLAALGSFQLANARSAQQIVGDARAAANPRMSEPQPDGSRVGQGTFPDGTGFSVVVDRTGAGTLTRADAPHQRYVVPAGTDLSRLAQAGAGGLSMHPDDVPYDPDRRGTVEVAPNGRIGTAYVGPNGERYASGQVTDNRVVYGQGQVDAYRAGLTGQREAQTQAWVEAGAARDAATSRETPGMSPGESARVADETTRRIEALRQEAGPDPLGRAAQESYWQARDAGHLTEQGVGPYRAGAEVLRELPHVDPGTGERAPTPGQVVFGGAPDPNRTTITAADPNRPPPPDNNLRGVHPAFAGAAVTAAREIPKYVTIGGEALNAATGGLAPELRDAGRAWTDSVNRFYTEPGGVFDTQARHVDFEKGRDFLNVGKLSVRAVGLGFDAAKAAVPGALGLVDEAGQALTGASAATAATAATVRGPAAESVPVDALAPVGR